MVALVMQMRVARIRIESALEVKINPLKTARGKTYLVFNNWTIAGTVEMPRCDLTQLHHSQCRLCYANAGRANSH